MDALVAAPDIVDPVASAPPIETAIADASGMGAASQGRERDPLRVVPADYGPYKMTNADFYPSQGVAVSQAGRVGQYGGSPIYTPTGVRWPFAVFAARGQALRDRQDKLDQQVAAFDPYGGLEKPPPPYMKGMDQLWDQKWSGLVDTWTQAKGSRAAAMREIASPGSEANIQYKKLQRDFNTLTAVDQSSFDKAVAINTAIAQGKWVADPKTTQLAKDIEEGMMGLGVNNYEKLAQMIPELEHRASVYEYLDNIKADEQAKMAIQEIQEMPKRQGAFDTQVQVKTLAPFRESLIRQLAPTYRGIVPDPEAFVREIMEAKYGDDLLVKYNQHRYPKSGGGSGASDEKGKAKWSVGVGVVQTRPEGAPKGTLTGTGKEERLVVDLFDIVGDKSVPLAQRTFNVNGTDTNLYAPQLQYNGRLNRWEIWGRDLNDKDIETIRKKVGDDEEAVNTYIATNTNIGTVRIARVDDNAAKMEGYAGYRDPNQMIAERLTALGEKASAEEVAATLADPEGRKLLMQILR